MIPPLLTQQSQNTYKYWLIDGHRHLPSTRSKLWYYLIDWNWQHSAGVWNLLSIVRIVHTVFTLLSFVLYCPWFHPYPSGLINSLIHGGCACILKSMTFKFKPRTYSSGLLNSLIHGGCACNHKSVIFKFKGQTSRTFPVKIFLMWMPQDLNNGKSTLVPAITRANIHLDLCGHIALMDRNRLWTDTVSLFRLNRHQTIFHTFSQLFLNLTLSGVPHLYKQLPNKQNLSDLCKMCNLEANR